MTVASGLEGADPTDLAGLREALALADPEGQRVVLVTDATPMRRNDGDPKDEAERLLAQQFEVRRVVLGEGRGAHLHADEEVLAEARTAVSGADCVVVIGSGTVTDVCKEATARTDAPLVVVQTAAS